MTTTANTETQTAQTTELLTPYRCAVLVNKILQEKGVDKVLPAQMFYTYVKKGFIPSTDKKVSPTDLGTWVTKYLAKNYPTV